MLKSSDSGVPKMSDDNLLSQGYIDLLMSHGLDGDNDPVIGELNNEGNNMNNANLPTVHRGEQWRNWALICENITRGGGLKGISV